MRFTKVEGHFTTKQQVLAEIASVGWNAIEKTFSAEAELHLQGSSEGGLMAQLFAANHPERVLSVGLLNSVVPHKYRPLVRARFEEGDAPISTTMPSAPVEGVDERAHRMVSRFCQIGGARHRRANAGLPVTRVLRRQPAAARRSTVA